MKLLGRAVLFLTPLGLIYGGLSQLSVPAALATIGGLCWIDLSLRIHLGIGAR